MAVWRNADGLDVKFGTEKARSLVDAGDIKSFNGAGENVIELELNLAELTEVEQILSDVVWLPKSAQVTWVKSVAEVVGATGVAIDMGLIHEDRVTTTGVGPQVLLAAFPLTDNYDGLGDTVTFYENATVPASVTGTGAAIGTILPTNAERYYITASRTTSTAFTAGRLRITIGYVLNALADNSN